QLPPGRTAGTRENQNRSLRDRTAQELDARPPRADSRPPTAASTGPVPGDHRSTRTTGSVIGTTSRNVGRTMISLTAPTSGVLGRKRDRPGDRVCWEGDLPERRHALASVLVRDALGHARFNHASGHHCHPNICRYLAAPVRIARTASLVAQ